MAHGRGAKSYLAVLLLLLARLRELVRRPPLKHSLKLLVCSARPNLRLSGKLLVCYCFM